jgi:hypothetical protein
MVGKFFALAQCTGYLELANVFDQYRIAKVVYKVVPVFNVAQVGSSPLEGTIVSVIDYDDANTPTNLDQLMEFNTHRIHDIQKPWMRTIYPRIASATFSGSTFSGYYAPSGKQWVDVGSTGVQHYGLKWGCDQNAADNLRLQVYTTYYLEFRRIR